MKITLFWDVVPCGLTNGHHHWEEPVACIFRAEVKLFEKKWCGQMGRRSINCCIQSHLTFAFPDPSVQFMLLCISPLPSISFILIYLLYIVIIHFIFHTSSSSLTYEHCIPSNSCHLMAASVPHCLFFLFLFLVLFILHILSYISFPLLCSILLCFIFTCGIYHKMPLFKGHWLLPYFSHIPSPITPYWISFTVFHFFIMCFLTSFPFLCCVLLYISPFVLTLPILPLCGLLVLTGSLLTSDPVSCFMYS